MIIDATNHFKYLFKWFDYKKEPRNRCGFWVLDIFRVVNPISLRTVELFLLS